jgi:polar amino acid transport system substrate-binding protein
MKKIFSVFTIALLLFVTACGNTADTEKEVLRVGMDLRWPPFETIDDTGNPSGISVAFAEELGQFLDMEVEIVNTEFGSLIPSLETGKIDVIIGSMSITDERKQKINFSDPYFYFPIITLVNANSGIETVDDMWTREGVKFVAPEGFFTVAIIEQNANNPEIITADNDASILQVKDGTADAFLVSPATVVGGNTRYPEETKILWDPVLRSPIGVGVSKDNEDLLMKVNEFIAGLEDGVYDRIGEEFNSVIAESLPGQTLRFYIDE